MTNKGPFATTPWIDGDVLNAADLKDAFEQPMVWYPMVGGDLTADAPRSIIGHSATTWSAQAGGTTYQTTDSGGSWSTVSSVLDTDALLIECRATATLGFGYETVSASSECIYTADSGATWTAKTNIPFANFVYDVSFPASGLIVAGGDDGAVKNVVFSTDQGSTWTDATTPPTATIYAIDMFDTSTGYAVDSSGNIWKTADGAVTWTDTTDNVTSAASYSYMGIHCLTADICVIISTGRLYHYTNSTNTVTMTSFTKAYNCARFTETSDGTLYNHMHDANDGWCLIASFDDGLTWNMGSHPLDDARAFSNMFSGQMVAKLGTTNQALLAPDGPIIKIGAD